jgi:hypothetical protein
MWRRIVDPEHLPILASELFGQIACSKNRIQNYCEQDYPASGRHDREDQAALPRHRAFRPNHDWAGPPPRLRRRTPDRAAPGSAKPRDYLEDITSDGIGNESRPLSLMSAPWVNFGTFTLWPILLLTLPFKLTFLGAADVAGETNLAAHRCSKRL